MLAKRMPLEWQEQAALFQWAALHTAQEPRLALLYAVPNGEKREKRTAAKLEKMGVKPGVPDLCLPVPRPVLTDHLGTTPPFHGLYIELKRNQNTVATPAQYVWLDALNREGYHATICAGWRDAAQMLCWYLNRQDLAKELR